jgi:hypothetical protein
MDEKLGGPMAILDVFVKNKTMPLLGIKPWLFSS